MTEGMAGNKSTTDNSIRVEIGPNLYIPLRGAKETTDADRMNYIIDCKCLICTVEYKCILDAAFAICPLCRSLSPLALTRKRNNNGASHYWGVGLGFISDEDDGIII